MTITLTALQKQRRDTASNWTSNNTVLLAGEWGIESDTKKFKIGDGSTAWQSLDYVPIPDANRSLPGNLVVEGDFTVNGTTTTIDTTTLTVEDKNIELGKVSTPTDTTADGGGITLKGATDKTINWVDSTDSWTLSENLDLANGKVLKINNAEILSATGLGSSVVSSSLTSVGTITTGTWNASAIAGSKIDGSSFASITSSGSIVISQDNAIHFNATSGNDLDAILRESSGNAVLINSRNDTIVNIDSNNDSTNAHFAVAYGAATSSSTELFRVQENGQVLIGSSSTDSSALFSIIKDTTEVLADNEPLYNNASPAFLTIYNTNNTGTGEEAGINLVTAGNANGAISIYGKKTGSYAGDLIFRFRNGASTSAERMRIKSDGNVGISTTSPDHNLSVVAANSATPRIGITNPSNDENFNISTYHDSNGIYAVIGANAKLDANGNNAVDTTGHRASLIHLDGRNSGSIQFSTADAGSVPQERMSIDSSGNVGIGTSSPTRPLHIVSDEDLTSFTGTANGAFCISNSDYATGEYSAIDFTYTGSDKPLGRIATKITSSGSFLSFGTSDTFFNGITNEALIIDPSGNISISDGNLVVANGHGIDFSAVADVATGENITSSVFNDYEEGTFTPSAAGSWTVTPQSLSGGYVKIGRMVHIFISFSGGSKSTITAGYLEGLPFATTNFGTGSVTDSSVGDQGNCLFFNTDRIWLTDNSFNATTYVTGQYTTG